MINRCSNVTYGDKFLSQEWIPLYKRDSFMCIMQHGLYQNHTFFIIVISIFFYHKKNQMLLAFHAKISQILPLNFGNRTYKNVAQYATWKTSPGFNNYFNNDFTKYTQLAGDKINSHSVDF